MNDLKLLESIKPLNDLLHKADIHERLRPLFVASILISLKHGYDVKKIDDVAVFINQLLVVLTQATKNNTAFLVPFTNLLNATNFKHVNLDKLNESIELIATNIFPALSTVTSQGQDLLNIFFTSFNKYLGKADKNQAFTPTHIVDFVTDLASLSANSKVLDPTCGSGAFLIQALIKMQKTTSNQELKQQLQTQIYGIERDFNVYGLTVSNMLLHNDTQSHLFNDSCFELKEIIKQAGINTILMNPPFNATSLPDKTYIGKSGDATKGFYFVKYVADLVNTGYLYTVLPYGAAIGSDKKIVKIKEEMLKNHTLEAVFSLPNDTFYPGTSVASCIMVFKLGTPHASSKIKTFFGYYKDDGFIKRKNIGRVPKIDWNITKKKWIDAYKNKEVITGFSTLASVNANDDWLAEAYIDIDYSTLQESDFIQTANDYLAYLLKTQNISK